MWGFASKPISAPAAAATSNSPNPNQASDISDDEISVNHSQEDGLECPICWESFNIVENVPYVLLCGHTLCKSCVLRLQSAIIKLPSFPIHLPFFISCPWCNLLSFRLFYKGNLKFPRKNYFLVWMVENFNKSHSCLDHHDPGSTRYVDHHDPGRRSSLRKSLKLFVKWTAKFPVVLVFLVVALYGILASIAILIVYIGVTILFAGFSYFILFGLILA